MQTEPILRVQKVSKAFPGVQALKNVDFEVYPGEVVALVGENGAGKSTLMKILAGAYTRDSGEMILGGQPFEPLNPFHAQQMGISIIYQEFNLSPTQTVAANVFVSREPRRHGFLGRIGFIDRALMEREAQKYLDIVKTQVSPRAIIRTLSVAERQQVEIAKALAVDARVIIMDEPTSALGADETQSLFSVIRDLKAQGRGIVFITHRMEEIFAIADRVIVFRDGERVGEMPIANATTDRIISLMVGREVENIFPKQVVEIGDVVMEVRGLTAYGMVQDVSFDLRRGEILGVAGLVGAGRTETAQLLFGAVQPDSGEIFIDGQQVGIGSPETAMQVGLGLVPEDRANQGLVLMLSVRENITMPTLRRFTTAGWVDRPAVEKHAQEYVDKLNVRTPSLHQRAVFLSGGNQQKIVVAKWLMSNPKVLILDEPTRGIDVGAKAEIHALMSELAKTGMGIIMISSEMPEILGMSDRIMVMHEGRVAAILDRKDVTQEKIMAYATGHAVEGVH